MTEEDPILAFEDSSKERLLKALGLSVTSEGLIVDGKNKVLTNQEYEQITFGEFGGVLKGSKVPIKKQQRELVKYFVNKKDA